jgi:TonB family protein
LNRILKLNIAIAIIIFHLCCACGSSNPAAETDLIPADELVLTEIENVDTLPEPVGSMANILKDLRYPEEARKAGVEGRVVIKFVVDNNGRVRSPEVVEGIGHGCDEEALRVISASTYKPATKNGVPVNVMYSAPILFRLSTLNVQSEK